MSTKTKHKSSNKPNVLTPNKGMSKLSMPKKTKPEDNIANQPNANKGTSGTNIAYDKVHGNRSKQISQNRNK